MEMNKTYSLIVSKRATQMLVSHAAFLAKVSPEAANRLVASFEETANSLATMPERCSWLITSRPTSTEKFCLKNGICFFFRS